MKRRMLLSAAVGAGGLLMFLPVNARADHSPVPDLCVAVDAEPVHLQVGYAPHGPEGCTRLP